MENLSGENAILKYLRQVVDGAGPNEKMPMIYPPAIARTLGFDLVQVDKGSATIQIQTSTEKHANPMGTIHGGVLCDIADAAIGTAHVTTLEEGESFTSIDLRINFFRPIWNTKLLAKAHAIQIGKTISYYECKILDERERLVAIVTSSVMTLRGEMAKGR